MLKSELIAQLSAIDGDLDIMMSSDPEGNSFSPVRVVEEARLDDGYCLPAEALPKGDHCICLWP